MPYVLELHAFLLSMTARQREIGSFIFIGYVFIGLLVAGCLAPPALGQSLTPDRPGFGTSSASVMTGELQVEGGYRFSKEHAERQHALGEMLLRYGFSEWLELRGGLNSFVLVGDPPFDERGYVGTSLGAKIPLLAPAGAPAETANLSVVAMTTLANATGSFETDGERVRQEARLAYDYPLGERWTVSTNAGLRFFFIDKPDTEWLASGTLAANLSARGAAYVGYAGIFADDGASDTYAEAGLTYNLARTTQVDVHGGLRLGDNDRSNFFAGVGFVQRL